MKVQAVQSPIAAQSTPTPAGGSTAAQDARARAIAKFSATPATTPEAHSPDFNQNAISPEEMSAVIAPTVSEPIEDVLEATTETPPEEAKVEQDPALSRQFAQLARQEKQLRLKAQQQEQAYKAKEAALAAREAELTAKNSKYDTDYIPKSQLKQDALSALEAAGLSYDDLTQQVINQQTQDPRVMSMIQRAEAKIAALEAQIQDANKAQVDQQSQQYQQAVEQIKIDTKALVQSNPEYEAIRAARAEKDVVELITETFNKDGILLSVEDAAQQVEDYLTEEAMKFTRLEKIKKRMSQVAPDSKPSTTQTQASPKQPQPMKTLTNANSSTRPMTARERAIAAMEGKLK